MEYILNEAELNNIISKTNRSRNQTLFLYNLLNGDIELLKQVEMNLANSFNTYCPADMEEVNKILEFKPKNNRLIL